MKRLRISGALLMSGSLALISSGAAGQDMGTPASAVENFASGEDGPELLVADNARLVRADDRVTISLKLITPEAGSYTYPETIGKERQAQPEAFTGWAFIFNNPQFCETPFECGPADVGDPDVKFGVYNFAGTTNQLSQSSEGEIQLNAASDGYVVLTGDVLVGQQERPVPDEQNSFPLENPMGAEVHAAIAPHGQLDPTTLPDELYNPTGNPACGCWWVAVFAPPQTTAGS
jgi:hypothetical protein